MRSYPGETLPGLRADTEPVRLLDTVIDQEFAHRPPGVRISDDIVEIDYGRGVTRRNVDILQQNWNPRGTSALMRVGSASSAEESKRPADRLAA